MTSALEFQNRTVKITDKPPRTKATGRPASPPRAASERSGRRLVVGQAGGGSDCDDDSATVYPGAPEVAKDGIDQDCDGNDAYDSDGDGHDDIAFDGDDCDDDSADVYPGAVDWMNDGIDSDCDGSFVDEFSDKTAKGCVWVST